MLGPLHRGERVLRIQLIGCTGCGFPGGRRGASRCWRCASARRTSGRAGVYFWQDKPNGVYVHDDEDDERVCAGHEQSEFYAIGRETFDGTASKNLFIAETLAKFHDKKAVKQTPCVGSDSTAADGMISRQGVGRVRHLATRYLWIQDAKRNGDLTIFKEDGGQRRGYRHEELGG